MMDDNVASRIKLGCTRPVGHTKISPKSNRERLSKGDNKMLCSEKTRMAGDWEKHCRRSEQRGEDSVSGYC